MEKIGENLLIECKSTDSGNNVFTMYVKDREISGKQYDERYVVTQFTELEMGELFDYLSHYF